MKRKLKNMEAFKVKVLLWGGKHTHQEISELFNVSRSVITKIHLGMKNITDKNGRYTDVEL